LSNKKCGESSRPVTIQEFWDVALNLVEMIDDKLFNSHPYVCDILI